MGGTITLESEVDVGSTFAVEVTLRTATKAQPSIDAFSDELLVGLRVLVVDDNSTNRTLLKTQLESWKMLPDVADTVPRAFEMLRSSAMLGKPYDIAALDAHMPDTDGLELARRVTADPVLQGLPMIMLTSGLYPEPAAMRGLGITQWLPKPVRSADLFDRLVRLMAPREKELHARRSYLLDPQPPAAVGGSVLLVEDSLVSQVVIKQLLTDLGFEVHCVRDGAAALERGVDGGVRRRAAGHGHAEHRRLRDGAGDPRARPLGPAHPDRRSVDPRDHRGARAVPGRRGGAVPVPPRRRHGRGRDRGRPHAARRRSISRSCGPSPRRPRRTA